MQTNIWNSLKHTIYMQFEVPFLHKDGLNHFSHVWLFATPWTVTHQATLSMGFSRQGYWSGFPCPPPGDLPNPGIEPASLGSPTLADGFFSTNATWEAHTRINIEIKKMLRTIKHGKAHGRKRYFYSTTLWETKETMGILIFKHFCRAIWMGEREYLRRISQSRLKGREWGKKALKLTIPGPCNHKSIDDTLFSNQQMTRIQEVIILSLGKGMVR